MNPPKDSQDSKPGCLPNAQKTPRHATIARIVTQGRAIDFMAIEVCSELSKPRLGELGSIVLSAHISKFGSPLKKLVAQPRKAFGSNRFETWRPNESLAIQSSYLLSRHTAVTFMSASTWNVHSRLEPHGEASSSHRSKFSKHIPLTTSYPLVSSAVSVMTVPILTC